MDDVSLEAVGGVLHARICSFGQFGVRGRDYELAIVDLCPSNHTYTDDGVLSVDTRLMTRRVVIASDLGPPTYALPDEDRSFRVKLYPTHHIWYG